MKYEKPIVIANEELAEGIYMASGSGGPGCYTCRAEIIQTPEVGRSTYCIHVDAGHDATHHSSHQTLTISFNKFVKYIDSNGTLKGGDGTCTLLIDYDYHSNAIDTIGLGNVYVEADDGLSILSTSLSCNSVSVGDCHCG